MKTLALILSMLLCQGSGARGQAAILPPDRIVPFIYHPPLTNGCVQCSYDLIHWYDGEGIVWQRHPLDNTMPYERGAYEVIPINAAFNPIVFYRVCGEPLNP